MIVSASGSGSTEDGVRLKGGARGDGRAGLHAATGEVLFQQRAGEWVVKVYPTDAKLVPYGIRFIDSFIEYSNPVSTAYFKSSSSRSLSPCDTIAMARRWTRNRSVYRAVG